MPTEDVGHLAPMAGLGDDLLHNFEVAIICDQSTKQNVVRDDELVTYVSLSFVIMALSIMLMQMRK